MTQPRQHNLRHARRASPARWTIHHRLSHCNGRTDPPSVKIGPARVRELIWAEGPERIISGESETTHDRSGHLRSCVVRTYVLARAGLGKMAMSSRSTANSVTNS